MGELCTKGQQIIQPSFSKVINKSDSYAEMKQWLILNYGGVSRIINDVISDLSRQNKPASNNSQGKFVF